MGPSMTQFARPCLLLPPTRHTSPLPVPCCPKVAPTPRTSSLQPHQVLQRPWGQTLSVQHLLVRCLQTPLQGSRQGRREPLQLHS